MWQLKRKAADTKGKGPIEGRDNCDLAQKHILDNYYSRKVWKLSIYLSYCCAKIPHKGNLKKEGFVLA